MWTDAGIEIVDRTNVPRKPGVAAAVAPTASEESRNSAAVAAILDGERLPPPTVTAVGLRVYLDPDDSQKSGNRFPSRPPGLRRPRRARPVSAAFGEWSYWRKCCFISGLKGAKAPWWGRGQVRRVARADEPGDGRGRGPSLALGCGELARDLLQIETRGPFAYDAERNVARFDVLPQADPNLPNDVRMTKVPSHPGVQSLFSQVLEIEFNGPPTGNQPVQPPGPNTAAKDAAGGPRFRKLHAWTYTPSRILTVSSDVDQLVARGRDLVHEQVPEKVTPAGQPPQSTEKTTLTGSPLIVIQEKNLLTAGGPKTPATLVIEPAPAPLDQSAVTPRPPKPGHSPRPGQIRDVRCGREGHHDHRDLAEVDGPHKGTHQRS